MVELYNLGTRKSQDISLAMVELVFRHKEETMTTWDEFSTDLWPWKGVL